ncbi:MAG: ABC transporter substrate binding protein [Azonexus sp.]
MLQLCRLALTLLLILAVPAWGSSIAVVISEQGGMYTEFSGLLEKGLAGTNWTVSSTIPAENLARIPGQPDLIVTVGSDALRKALGKADSTPVLATLLPKQNYEKIMAEFRRHPGRVTAIYLDQPAARQAAFVNFLLPGQKRAGMLFSSETKNTASQYRLAFGNAGIKLDGEDIDSDNMLLPALNALLGRVNYLVAIPDSTIYRRDNIKAILITAFRYQRPVIAYSPSFVNAGALAALHTTPAQIARQTADAIINHGTSLQAPTGPNQFAIAINSNVAQSLNLNVPDEATIRRAMLGDKEAR